MNPSAIIRDARADGLSLALAQDGTITVEGGQDAANRWIPTIRKYKPAIIAALQEAANETNCSCWLFHFTDRDDLPVTFATAVDHTAALACYPNAVAAEPISDRPQRQPTNAETKEITALILAIYADDTDDCRVEALAAALADPEGALLCYRTIARDRGIATAEAAFTQRSAGK